MRFLSIVFLISAAVLLVLALWPLLVGTGYDPLLFGTAWSMIEPKSLIGIGKFLELNGLAALYDSLILPVLGAALWIVCAVIGVLLFALSWVRAARS